MYHAAAASLLFIGALLVPESSGMTPGAPEKSLSSPPSGCCDCVFSTDNTHTCAENSGSSGQ